MKHIKTWEQMNEATEDYEAIEILSKIKNNFNPEKLKGDAYSYSYGPVTVRKDNNVGNNMKMDWLGGIKSTNKPYVYSTSIAGVLMDVSSEIGEKIFNFLRDKTKETSINSI